MRILTPIFVTLSLLSSVSQAAYSQHVVCKTTGEYQVSIDNDANELVVGNTPSAPRFVLEDKDQKLSEKLFAFIASTDNKAGAVLENTEDAAVIALKSKIDTAAAYLKLLQGTNLFNSYKDNGNTIEDAQQNRYIYNLTVKNAKGLTILNRNIAIDCQAEGFGTSNGL